MEVAVEPVVIHHFSPVEPVEAAGILFSDLKLKGLSENGVYSQ